MKQAIEQEVFELHPFNVVKASYRESVYYLAGADDITSYVNKVGLEKGNEKERLEEAMLAFLKANPEKNILPVKMFDFVLLDDPTTSARFVMTVCFDLFHYQEKRCHEVIEALNTVGHYHIGTFSDEYACTLGYFIESYNEQKGENLGWDKLERSPNEVRYSAALNKLEVLIRRDYPADL